MNDGKAPWPKWAPSSLIRIYELLVEVPPEAWVSHELDSYSSLDALDVPTRAALLQEIGDKKTVLTLLQRLCSDLRMRRVWEQLRELVEAPEANSCRLGIWTLDFEQCAFEVAHQAMVASAPNPTLGVNRAQWKHSFADIAKKAHDLAEAIYSVRLFDYTFDSFSSHYIPTDQWQTVREELALEIESSLLRDDGGAEFAIEQGRRLVQGLPLLPESEPEMEPEQAARFETAVNERSDWLDRKLAKSLEFVSLADVLRQIEQSAKGMAGSPPFLPPGSSDDRLVFAVATAFSTLFWHGFGKWLDELVATLTEVVTGQSVSADSVKMRRSRMRRHYRSQVTE